MLRKSWDEQVGWFFDLIDRIQNLAFGPDPVGIVTSYTGSPVDWALDFGDKYRDSSLQRNSEAIDTCMKNGYQFPISGELTTKSIRDGILIPPTTNLLIRIPLIAPNTEINYDVKLSIPYYDFLPMTWAPAGCAGFKLSSRHLIWSKSISVKKKM